MKDLKIQNIEIDKLKQYKNNPRIIGQDAINAVAKSIEQFGFKIPMIIDKNYEIVCGHNRYLACKQLGIKEVPCIIADDLTDEQIKAFRLADNKVAEFANWDYELLNTELEELSFCEDIELNFEDFGFNLINDNGLDVEDEDFSTDEQINKKEKTICCPHCGKEVIL